jgi:hypothetical protein
MTAKLSQKVDLLGRVASCYQEIPQAEKHSLIAFAHLRSRAGCNATKLLPH